MAAGDLFPFFSYFGSKWRLAGKGYAPPLYGTIVEPFAGSACYATRFYDRKVVLYDRSETIVGIWNYLIKSSTKDILALPDVPDKAVISDLPVCQEARHLIGFWCQIAQPRVPRIKSGWSGHRLGKTPESGWSSKIRARIAHQIKFIRHWKIRCCSYESIDLAGKKTWFVDPPYQKQGRGYDYSSRAICFPDLASWCKRLCGQVIVCESAQASWLPFRPIENIRTTIGNSFVEGVWEHNT